MISPFRRLQPTANASYGVCRCRLLKQIQQFSCRCPASGLGITTVMACNDRIPQRLQYPPAQAGDRFFIIDQQYALLADSRRVGHLIKGVAVGVVGIVDRISLQILSVTAFNRIKLFQLLTNYNYEPQPLKYNKRFKLFD